MLYRFEVVIFYEFDVIIIIKKRYVCIWVIILNNC